MLGCLGRLGSCLRESQTTWSPFKIWNHLYWLVIQYCTINIFNSWVRASVPRVIAGTGICKWVTRSLVVDDFVINRVRTREREDLSFPKKHALAEVRWHQIPRWERASCATARLEDRGLTKFKTRKESFKLVRFKSLWLVQALNLTRRWAFALRRLQLRRWLDLLPCSNVVGYVYEWMYGK